MIIYQYEKKFVKIFYYIINYNCEFSFFKNIQIDIKMTTRIEINKKYKIKKKNLKILKNFNFCFYKFIKKIVDLIFSNIFFEFFKNNFDKIDFSLLQ